MPTRESADLLIEARWLLPVAPAGGARADHAVAVSAGRITAVGPAAELRARFEARETVVRANHALLPGLVNAYTQACHSLLRAAPVYAPRARWLRETLAPLEARGRSADFVRDGTRLGIAEMLRAGITCFAELSPLPEETARVAAAAQVRAAIGLPVADGPTPWAENATAHFATAERLWDQYRADSRISLYFAPLAAQGLSDATLTRVRRVADELDARVAVHLGDPAERRAPGPLRRLADLGLLNPGFAAIGALDADEVELIARHGACLIACPQADLRLGGEPARVPLLEGSRSGLGTDTPAAVGAFDILAEARLAALLSGFSAAQALQLATLGGATALGLQAQIGSIEAGKAADLTCIDMSTLECRSTSSIEDAIVFAATRAQVSDVWTGGRAAVSAGRLLGFDEEELATLPARWAQRLQLEAAA